MTTRKNGRSSGAYRKPAPHVPDYVNGFLRATRHFRFRPIRVVLADGTSLSIQAGDYAYSSPRSRKADHYSKVEVGAVEPRDAFGDALKRYQDYGGAFAFVHVGHLNELIVDRGGIVGVLDEHNRLHRASFDGTPPLRASRVW